VRASASPQKPVEAPLEAFQLALEERLRRLFEAERRRCTELGPAADEVVDALERSALAGGKRVRSKLMFAAFAGAGGTPTDPQVVDAGAALELLHTGCLVHDDIMDASPLRRGLPTVHAAFEALHATEGWRGDSAAFGASTAILVGDLAFYHAMRLMSEVGRDAQRVFYDVGTDVGMGQYLDLRAAAYPPTVDHDPLMVARYKTGRYTVEGPLHLGAALAGRLAELGPALSGYGRPLGEAYQLRDDLLGAFGDPSETGKPSGNDLRQGKCTLLLTFAREEKATLPDRRAAGLLERAGTMNLSEEDVAPLQELLVAVGARDRAVHTCKGLVRRALEALDGAAVRAESKEALAMFAGQMLHGLDTHPVAP
jgi:geranylgeranyl diphosphate synthase type I